MSEQWRAVIGYEGNYEVSSKGRVKSLNRIVPVIRQGKLGTRRIPERILKPGRHVAGYPQVFLYREGTPRMEQIHQLVAAAFVGPRPEGHEVRHRDGDSGNPRATNLTYGTRKQNYDDAIRHGAIRKTTLGRMAGRVTTDDE